MTTYYNVFYKDGECGGLSVLTTRGDCEESAIRNAKEYIPRTATIVMVELSPRKAAKCYADYQQEQELTTSRQVSVGGICYSVKEPKFVQRKQN